MYNPLTTYNSHIMARLVIILTYNVTIQMKSLWHNFHTVLIISQDFTN